MKRFLLMLAVLVLPLASSAQGQKKKIQNDDQRYLAGAVPVVDGQVVFSRSFSVPTLSTDDVFQRSLEWVDGVLGDNQASRVVMSKQEDGYILAINEKPLIFSYSFITVDRAVINYAIEISSSDGVCNAAIKRIKYTYPGQQKTPDRYTAEEQITDENALNKGRTKLSPMTGKFRAKTIDHVDSLFTTLGEALGTRVEVVPAQQIPTQLAAAGTGATQGNTGAAAAESAAATAGATGAVTATTTTAAATATATPTATPQTPVPQKLTLHTGPGPVVFPDLAGYKRISPEEISGQFIKMVSQDWMLITAGDDASFNMMTASWGGIGFLYNKPVAFCFVNPARYTYKFMENGDFYTLTFYTENYREALDYCGSASGRDADKVKGSGLTPITVPSGAKAFKEAWMIIECRKFVSQSISLDAIQDEKVKDQWSTQAMHKMYIGEILNVYVK